MSPMNIPGIRPPAECQNVSSAEKKIRAVLGKGCDPERYNTDEPVERLLKKGVTSIIMVDMTTSGVRFSKTFDVVQMTKLALNKWNKEHGTAIPLVWVNDPNNVMERSYPTKPEGWTRIKKTPEVDPQVPLEGNPNPIAEDPLLAQLFAEGIEKGFSASVPDNATGVILFNHALHDYNEYFDPKIDDTLILNKNIKALLIERHPDIDPDHIIGAFGGIMEINPVNRREERSGRCAEKPMAMHGFMRATSKCLVESGATDTGMLWNI